jgi:hypothetical protein
MMKNGFVKIVFIIFILSLFSVLISAQQTSSPEIKSQEISDVEGIPVLIKHLPDWENARNSATYVTNVTELQNALGEKPIFSAVEFVGGTEAVIAPYPEGKLLIIEYSTPQASVDTDNKVKQILGENGENQESAGVFYRRIGNYNVFLFEGTSESDANDLFDQIKYEKVVQWLGEDPTLLQRAERAMVRDTADLFLSTAMAIVLGLGLAVLTGIVIGIVFYRIRRQKRGTIHGFTDAGGMTRLNLDDFTPPISTERLLND